MSYSSFSRWYLSVPLNMVNMLRSLVSVRAFLSFLSPKTLFPVKRIWPMRTLAPSSTVKRTRTL